MPASFSSELKIDSALSPFLSPAFFRNATGPLSDVCAGQRPNRRRQRCVTCPCKRVERKKRCVCALESAEWTGSRQLKTRGSS